MRNVGSGTAKGTGPVEPPGSGTAGPGTSQGKMGKMGKMARMMEGKGGGAGTPGGGAASAAGFFNLLSVALPAEGGKTYDFSAWVLSDGTAGSGDELGIMFMGAKDPVQDWVVMDIPGNQPFWTRLEKQVTVPAGAVRMTVAARVGSPKGTVWVDDVSLRPAGRGAELLENGGFERR